MAAPVRIVLFALVLFVFGVGVYDVITNYESNGCEMTYMFVQPEYLEVTLSSQSRARFPQYGLHFYGEGTYAKEAKNSDFKLTGVPVLFIPGNAGSPKQVRSLGSVALRKTADHKLDTHFNYFSIDYNEELSGLFGGTLQRQTEFAYICVRKILSLYKEAPNPPKSVIIVGHSMGGMIARALFTIPRFKPEMIQMIVTQSTPHQAPVIALDYEIAAFYEKVNTYWRENNKTLQDVTVVSTGGGHRDILVRSGLASLDGIVAPSKSVVSNTMMVPRGWVSADHLCAVWCKQIVLATKRALFDIVDKSTKQMAVSSIYRTKAFEHHMLSNPGPKKFKGAYDQMIPLDKTIKWEMRPKKTWNVAKEQLAKTRYSVMQIPRFEDYSFVAISNIDNVAWVGACSNRITIDPNDKKQKAPKKPAKDEPICKEIGNFAQYANMLPPLYSEKKVVHMSHEILEEFDYLVNILPKSKSRIEMSADLYLTAERHLEYNTTGLLGFLGGFPSSAMTPAVIIEKTAPGAIFYNISLNGLDIPLQAYTAHIYSKSCKEAAAGNFAGTIAKLYVPWSNENTYTHIRPGNHGNISLKLQSGKPAGFVGHAQLHLYLYPQCTYEVSITIAWSELVGQFVRFYGLFLPAFLVIQVLMVLCWQLHRLDEEGLIPTFSECHTRWGQPWRVVPLAVLLRFLIGYPEEDNISMKIGLPPDDSISLTRQNIFYATIPLISYLTCNALMGVYASIVQAGICFWGRVISLFCKRCCLSSAMDGSVVNYLQYLLYFGGIAASSQVCGTLGIIVVYVMFVFKTLASYVRAYNSKFQVPHAWNRFNINFSFMLLSQLVLVLNAPPLITWAKNLQYSTFLENDTSKWTGILMCVSAFLFTYSRFPYIASEFFTVASNLLWISCILMVFYALESVYRVSYFVVSDLLIIAIPATVLSFMPVQPMGAAPPEDEDRSEVITAHDVDEPDISDSEVNEGGDAPEEEMSSNIRKRSKRGKKKDDSE